MKPPKPGDVGVWVTMALENFLQSVNEHDSNGEPANVVDGLFAIARAVQNLATAVEGLGQRGGTAEW